MRSIPELLSLCTGVCTGCVSGEEAWLVLTDDSSSEMVLASGIPVACLLLVRLGSDLSEAGRDFGICELQCAQGPLSVHGLDPPLAGGLHLCEVCLDRWSYCAG